MIKLGFINKLLTKTKVKSPEILFVAGVVSGVAGFIVACKAAPKASAMIDDYKDRVQEINDICDDTEYCKEHDMVPEEERKKGLRYEKIALGKDLIKVYALPVGLEIGSVICLTGSHKLLKKRNMALTAAATVATKKLSDYRKRVIERFGEQLDKELMYDIRPEKVEEKTVDPETGKEKTVKKTKQIANALPSESDYAKVFDSCSSTLWSADNFDNKNIIRQAEQSANRMLISRKYLWLWEVYKLLGMKPTVASYAVGWFYDPERPEKFHNKVDFGLKDSENEITRRFMDGFELVCIIDPNVDGPILDYIDQSNLLERI